MKIDPQTGSPAEDLVISGNTYARARGQLFPEAIDG